MAQHTLEAQKIKRVVIDALLAERDKWLAVKKKGGKVSSANTPKNYNRMSRLIAGGDDNLYMDTLEELLSSNASPDEIKNRIRTISEREVPGMWRRSPIDQLHHIYPVELMQVLAEQEPEVMLDFLLKAQDQGMIFSDSPLNLSSFMKMAHAPGGQRTAKPGTAIDLKSINNIQAPIAGVTAHPKGTNKGIPDNINRQYSSGSELFDTLKPYLDEAKAENDIGVKASVAIRERIDDMARKSGIKFKGSVFDYDQTQEVVKQTQDLLRHPTLLGDAASEYNGLTYQNTDLLNKLGLAKDDYNAIQLTNKTKAIELYGDMRDLVWSNGILRIAPHVKDIAKNKAVQNTLKFGGLAAATLIGPAADATEVVTGSLDAANTKQTNKKRFAGGLRAINGALGLASLKFPVLAPLAVGSAVGNTVADVNENRVNPNLTSLKKYSSHVHTENNPVTIQAPAAKKLTPHKGGMRSKNNLLKVESL